MTVGMQKKLGVILQYAQMGLSILISFAYTPIMLKILGQAEYGIYNLSSSIISYLGLLSLGFGASYIRFYSVYKKDNDEKGIAKLNGLFLLTFAAISIITIVCGAVLSLNVSLFFNETYTARDKNIAVVLMLFMTFNLAMSFLSSVFVSYITAQEKFVFQKLLSIVRTVIGPFLTLPALLMGFGSIGMVVVTTVVGLLVDVSNVAYCIGKLKMKFTFSHPDFKLLKSIAGFSVWLAINQIIDQINWQTDKVVLGKICGSVSVAIYAIGSQINSYFLQFATAISNVFTPQIHRIENSGKSKEQINSEHLSLMIKVGRLQFMILALVLSGFIFFGKFFILKWAGEGYENSYYVALLLICPAIISLIQNIGMEIQRAKNRHRFRSIAYLIMAFFNVLVSVWFASMWGEIGAAIGTTLSIVLANGIIMNVFYHKALHIDMIKFWKSILRFIPSLIAPIAAGVIMNIFFPPKTLIVFGIQVIIYTVIYCVSVYFMGMNQDERNIIKRPVLKVLNKVRGVTVK